MGSGCDCYVSVEASASEERGKARAAEHSYEDRLLAFRSAIVEGATELAARHLFKAGVYLACIEDSFSKNPSPDDVMRYLADRLKGEADDTLYRFYLRNAVLIQSQISGVTPGELLKGILRRKEGTKGLLEANARNEFNQARVALERAGQLSEQLESWKEGIRLESRVSIVEVVDMHASS